MTGRVPVNLNFTAGREAMASAVEQCSIRTIVTSKAFLAKAKIEPMDGTIFLEDVLAGTSKTQKARAWLQARWMPEPVLATSCPELMVNGAPDCRVRMPDASQPLTMYCRTLFEGDKLLTLPKGRS
jgi:acyl-[acyl-carrier-protein]-phospholipid O-acyltransferase/long-chain-fatty-acid--[acyl-carrier-protein] ligase